MGVTDDFEIAIEEGSTMIRLGRTILVKINHKGGKCPVYRKGVNTLGFETETEEEF